MKSLRTGCQDFFIVRIVEADWHISIQSQKMGKYMIAIRHSGVAGTTINIIAELMRISGSDAIIVMDNEVWYCIDGLPNRCLAIW